MTNELQIWCGNEQLADGSPFVNPTDQGKGVVEEITVQGDQALEILPRINALSPDVFDRYTKDKEITVKIGREHASFAAAIDFYLTHDEALPGRAALTISLTEEGVTYSYRSEGSGWRGVTQKPTGLFTLTEYRVVRGERFVSAANDPEATTGTVLDAGSYADGYNGQAIADGGHYGDLPEPAGSPAIDGGTYA